MTTKITEFLFMKHTVFGEITVLLVVAITMIAGKSCCFLIDKLKRSFQVLIKIFQLPFRCSTCQPYPLPPTSRQIARSIPSSSNGTEARQFPNPDCPTCYSCIERCVNVENYEEDKYRASEVCRVRSNEEAIKREIWTYGSVTAQFDVYPSFFSYGNGVYQHDEMNKSVPHAVKLVSLPENRNLGLKWSQRYKDYRCESNGLRNFLNKKSLFQFGYH